jgi:hypothetical protein
MAAAWTTMVATGACVIAVASTASAASPARRYALVWTRSEGAEACPDARSIEEALQKALGPISFVPRDKAELVIEAAVRKRETLRADLALRDAAMRLQGERTLESDDATCGELVKSVALVAAVMIDPEAAANAAEIAPPPVEPVPATTPPAVESPPASPTPDESVAPPRTRRSTVLAPVAAVATGMLPTVATGFGIDVWYRAQRHAMFGVGLRYWSSQTVQIAGTSAGGDFQLIDSIVSFCPVRAEWNALELVGCGQLDLGLLLAKGFGGTATGVARRPLVAPGAAARIAYAFTDRFELAASGAVEVPFRRDEFQYQRPDRSIALFEQSPVSARLEIGLGYAW